MHKPMKHLVYPKPQAVERLSEMSEIIFVLEHLDGIDVSFQITSKKPKHSDIDEDIDLELSTYSFMQNEAIDAPKDLEFLGDGLLEAKQALYPGITYYGTWVPVVDGDFPEGIRGQFFLKYIYSHGDRCFMPPTTEVGTEIVNGVNRANFMPYVYIGKPLEMEKYTNLLNVSRLGIENVHGIEIIDFFSDMDEQKQISIYIDGGYKK